MKEEYNLLQTYEIFLKIMYISLLKELYDKANRLTNSYMEGEFESKTAEQLTTDNFSYINRDLVGAKQELVKYEVLPEIIFDTSARSYVYKFSGTKEIRAKELYPKSKVHRVRERDVHIYVKKGSEGSWEEVRNWKFNKDEKNGKLSFVFKEAVSAGYVKVRSIWDDRNVENESIDDYSTFKGKPNNLLRIWTLENTLTEEYSYDGNSNRVYLTENGNGFSYEYYKNTNGGNTAKVRYDGKWYYTYDANGNRTSKAKKLEADGTTNKTLEYWTYEWDLWNRLVKVVQYNAPDEGECVDVSYEYDALNHRIKRTNYDENNKEQEVTKYAYGRNGALAYQEKTVDGNVTKRSFTYLNNEIVGFTDKVGGEETAYYTVTDIQGSITEVYDGSSKLVWKSGYTAFGEIAGETVDLIDFDGMYTGCDYDSATGLTYHWNRWRSEDGSVFISEDPIRDGMNWYGYAGCNPMVYVDPTGLAPYINGVYDGPYNPDYNPGVPVEGPQPNPSGMPQGQSINKGQEGNYQDFWNSFSNGFTNTLNSLFNLDFGTDFGSKAWDSFSSGHILQGVLYEIYGTIEAGLDLGVAYFGAGVLGAGFDSVGTLFTTGSTTAAAVSFEYSLNNNLGIVKGGISSVLSALFPTSKNSRNYTTAFNFYKNAGFSELEAIDHMQGIDFDKNVQIKKLKQGTFVEQWQNPKFPQGKYYSPVGTDPNTLGINTEGRVKSLYQLNKDTYVLQSTAKNTLGNTNLPIWAQGEGGGIQFFTTEQQNFVKVK